jgi:hypothetical protein
MSLCIHCNQTELVCSCNVEDPRTYWSILLSYVSRGATKWHPTEKSGPLSTITRGSFASKAKAYEWAMANIPGHTFALTEYARGNYIAPAFDEKVLKAAVSKYFSIACGRNTTNVLLDDSIRQETAEWMHLNHPIWIAQFNMDLVEWILVTYHGLKNE